MSWSTPKMFVLASIDKACNNVAIMCKRDYLEVALNETRVIGHGNDTNLVKVVIR